MGILLSFLPWIVFWTLSSHNNYQVSALAATGVVIFLNLRNIVKRNIKILDLGTLIFFILLTAVSFFSKATWIDSYSTPLSDVAMFAIAFISLIIRKPFTIQYAYEQVDPQYWNTPKFYTTNRTITAVWCIAFAVKAFLSYLNVCNPQTFFWVMNIIVLIGAIKFTYWYPDYVKSKD